MFKLEFVLHASVRDEGAEPLDATRSCVFGAVVDRFPDSSCDIRVPCLRLLLDKFSVRVWERGIYIFSPFQAGV